MLLCLLFMSYVVMAINPNEIPTEVMANVWSYLGEAVNSLTNANAVSKSFYNAWKHQNRQVLLDIAFLDELILKINESVYDYDTASKLIDIHSDYSE